MNILMLTESVFPRDIRVKREAYKLNENNHKITVISIKDKGQSFFEIVNNVHVYRIPKIELFHKVRNNRTDNAIYRILDILKALIGYGFEYSYFTIGCFILSLFVLIRDKFDVIHTHNPPDTLFVVALFYKIFFKKKFIYDHHDLSPDLYLEKYPGKAGLVYRILILLEVISCKVADLIIATNNSYKEIEIQRAHVSPEDIFVVRYGPDLEEIKKTKPIKDTRFNNKTILCYLGEINIQDGVSNIIDVLWKLVYEYNEENIICLIIGDGDYLNAIKLQTKKLSLDSYVIFTGYVWDKAELNKYLSAADIFVDAAPSTFLNENSTFIKHMEYMVFEKPIVSFSLKESMYSLQNAGVFVPSNDIDKMASIIIELIKNEKARKIIGENAKKRIQELTWDKVSVPLIEAYNLLERIR